MGAPRVCSDPLRPLTCPPAACPQPSHSLLSSPHRIRALRDVHTRTPHPAHSRIYSLPGRQLRRVQTCLCLLAALSQDS